MRFCFSLSSLFIGYLMVKNEFCLKFVKELLCCDLGIGAMANLFTKLLTWREGEKIGEDQNGNIYYQGRKPDTQNKKRRWVIYKNLDEASLVPPGYHGWLHYTTDEFPDNQNLVFWLKPHQANLSGTDAKYLPVRAKATGDYQAWQP